MNNVRVLLALCANGVFAIVYEDGVYVLWATEEFTIPSRDVVLI